MSRKHWNEHNGEAPAPLRSSWRDWMAIARHSERDAPASDSRLANWKTFNPKARSGRFRMIGGSEAA
jgi:hypothetical protein